MPEAKRPAARPSATMVAAATATAVLAAGAGALIGRGLVGWETFALLAAGVALAVLTFRRLEFGLIALLFTLPLDTFGRLITRPVTVTVFHVVLLICLAAWVRLLIMRRLSLQLSWLDIGVVALVGAGLWSLPFSLAPSTTVVSVVRLLFLWAFTLVYTNGITTAKGLRRLLGWLAITGVAFSLLGLVQYFLPGVNVGFIREFKRAFNIVLFSRVGALFYDPNYFAGMLSGIVAMALALLAHARSRRAALVWGAAAAVMGLTLVLTFSRGGWVGAAVGLVAAVFTAPRHRRAWLVTALLTVVVLAVVLAPDLIVSRVVSIANVDTDVSVATRYYMTASMQAMIAAKPVFGAGLGAFDREYPSFRRPGTSFTIDKPHQVPLAFITETGVAGLLAEIALLGAVLLLYWHRRPGGWDPLEAAVLAGTAAMLIGTLFEYYLYFEYVWLFLALSVVATRLVRSNKEEIACSPKR